MILPKHFNFLTNSLFAKAKSWGGADARQGLGLCDHIIYWDPEDLEASAIARRMASTGPLYFQRKASWQRTPDAVKQRGIMIETHEGLFVGKAECDHLVRETYRRR